MSSQELSPPENNLLFQIYQVNVLKFQTARDDVVEMRETKGGENDVTSRALSTRKQSVISNLSGRVNVLKLQTARDDVVEMRVTKDRESDVTSRTLHQKTICYFKFIR